MSLGTILSHHRDVLPYNSIDNFWNKRYNRIDSMFGMPSMLFARIVCHLPDGIRDRELVDAHNTVVFKRNSGRLF